MRATTMRVKMRILHESIVAVLRDNIHITSSLERAFCVLVQRSLQLSVSVPEVQSLLSPLNRQKRKVIA